MLYSKVIKLTGHGGVVVPSLFCPGHGATAPGMVKSSNLVPPLYGLHVDTIVSHHCVIYLIFYFHFIFAKSCLLVTFNFFSASTLTRSDSLRLRSDFTCIFLTPVHISFFTTVSAPRLTFPFLTLPFPFSVLSIRFCPFPFYGYHSTIFT